MPAALAYGAALANAPPDEALDAPTLKAVARGRVVHGAYTRQLRSTSAARIADAESQCSPVERRRLDAFIDTTLRIRRRYRQEPLGVLLPGPAGDRVLRARASSRGCRSSKRRPRPIGAGARRHPARGRRPGSRRTFTTTSTCRSTSGASSTIRRAGARTTSTIRASRSRSAAAGRRRRWRLCRACRRREVALRSPSAMFSVLAAEDADSRRTPASRTSASSCTCRSSCRRAAASASAARRASGASARPGSSTTRSSTKRGTTATDPRYILICDVWSPRLSPEERAAIARNHRRDRRLQRHDAAGARLIGPDETTPCS